MSRVAKNPIVVPSSVEVTVRDDGVVFVRGPLGELSHKFDSTIAVEHSGDRVMFRVANEGQQGGAMSGTARALVANMVVGVNKGFEKTLILVGVGYRAQSKDGTLSLTLGFSHPVTYRMPEGVRAETPTQTEVIIKGIDKQKVGQVAADLRAFRRPEPYKGKGIRYVDEVVVIKETKKK